MKPAPRRWEVRPAQPLDGYPPILGQIFASRGHDAQAATTLVDESRTAFHDPYQLAGMTDAVIALGVAVRERQRIAIYGDYDADGVTACAMLTLALRAGGADVIPYIPNRMTEGYGLHSAALTELASRGVECVVTVDCGTSSVEVAQQRPAGMRLIITDHHLPLAPDGTPPALAPADALVNPKQPACTYPFDALAGAGVAWKLLQALENESIVPAGSAMSLIGLAALGTVADMMPLKGENRLIVKRGLDSMTDNIGLRALCNVAGLHGKLRAADLAFSVGPRINAAGRMEDARLALRLCLSTDAEEARTIAAQLNEQNIARQGAVARALIEAEERVAELPEDLPAIVLGDAGWPMGIVGLVAGRLAERYARPTFIACLDPEEAKGSARSVRGVHIVRALDGAAKSLIRYGGHAAAAGFSLDANRFEEFVEQVSASTAEQISGIPRERLFTIDSHIVPGEANVDLCKVLDALEPCGQGNAQPLLAFEDCEVLNTSSFGADKQHLRVILGKDGGMAEAIAFNKPHLIDHLPRGRRIDACFSLELDTWQGNERVRARLRDVRPAGTSGVSSPSLSAQAVRSV